MPHFISTVVVIGMLKTFLTPGSGMISNFLVSLCMDPVDLLSYPNYFRTLFVVSDIWQHTGWNAIIYFAAIAGISPSLYESSTIDGANKFKQIIYITIPCILPTIVTLLILRTGSLLSVGFEKTLLMQVPATYSVSDVIATYVYRQGLVGGQFSYSTAVGIFNSLVNFAFLITSNYASRKLSEYSLW
jgi:putative aldouronate transport system permease protein